MSYDNNDVHLWPDNTILITDSSIINGLEEKCMNKKFNVKVGPFPGAKVNDMFYYLTPLLQKRPSCIILQIGSSDAVDKPSSEILAEILNLLKHIETTLPLSTIYLSAPVLKGKFTHFQY